MLSSRTAGDNCYSNDNSHGNVDKPDGHCHVYCIDYSELSRCTAD